MAIESHGWHQYVLTCDICETRADPGFAFFQEARAWARCNGWQLRKEQGEWVNYCPDCAIAEGLIPPPRGERVVPPAKETDSSVLRESPYAETYFHNMQSAMEEVKSGKFASIQRDTTSSNGRTVAPDVGMALDDALARIRAAAGK